MESIYITVADINCTVVWRFINAHGAYSTVIIAFQAVAKRIIEKLGEILRSGTEIHFGKSLTLVVKRTQKPIAERAFFIYKSMIETVAYIAQNTLEITEIDNHAPVFALGERLSGNLRFNSKAMTVDILAFSGITR
jgi:hypothetical protein